MPEFRCTACQRQLRVNDELAGKQVSCPCGQLIHVPFVAKPISSGKPAAPASPPKSTTPDPPAGRVVQCTACQRKLRAPASAEGKAVRCSCGNIVPVTESPAASGEQSHDAWINALPTPAPTAANPRPAQPATARSSANSSPSGNSWLEELSAADGSPAPAAPQSSNPYAPSPTSYSNYKTSSSTGPTGNAEAIRREHIRHEASVRSIGTLHILSGSLCTFIVILGVIGFVLQKFFLPGNAGASRTIGEDLVGLAVLAICGVIGWFFIWTGRGIKKLKQGPRTAATVLSAIGLLSFPVGTLIHGYFLWLLHSEKGNTIFTREYRKIVRATPHVQYPTSIILIGLLIFLLIMVLMVVVVAVLAVILSATRR